MYIDVRGNELNIEIASTRERLEQLKREVEPVITEEERTRGSGDELVIGLKGMLNSIEDLLEDEAAASIGYGEQRTQQQVEEHTNHLIQRFEAVGQLFHITQFEGLKNRIDPDTDLLKQAVDQVEVVEFMRMMVDNKTINQINREKFSKIFNDRNKKIGTVSAAEWIGDAFRNARKAHHEWIPVNLIDEVVQRAASADSALEGIKWIDLQHELRTGTSWVIFKPSGGDITKLNNVPYIWLYGHTGAIYRGISPQTRGQEEFHHDLETTYQNHRVIASFLDATKMVFQNWVWRGSDEPLPNPPYPDLSWTSRKLPLNVPVNVQSMERSQKQEYNRTAKMFDDLKSKFG